MTDRKLRIFISYASQDKPIVRDLYRRLESEEWIEPWLDEKSLLPGQEWRVAIEEAVETSDVVIICLSTNSVTKEGFVQKELRYAREIALEKPENTIFLIPLRLDDCDTPRGLRSFQWADYFGEGKDQSYRNLLVSLKNRHQQITFSKPKDINTTAGDKYIFESIGSGKKPRLKSVANPIMMSIGLIALFGIAGVVASQYFSSRSPTPTPTLPTTATVTDLPDATPNVLDTATPSKPSSPVIGSTWISPVDGMVLQYVPAGEFEMGSKNGYPDEEPVHTASVDAFWMGKTEVTNEMYSLCIEANACAPLSRSDYYSRDASSANYPVVFVSWDDATQYCAWTGGRLPTEAEWEFAARGTDGRDYPWGNQFACSRGNFDDETSEDPESVSGGPNCDGYQYLAPVGTFPDGVSPFGLLDMSGNVWEWVSDWYGVYKPELVVNPTGPESGDRRVVRGGAWLVNQDMMFRTPNRYRYPPDLVDDNVGFRCVIPED
jgi:formylglycine-generating enzyme required for sulfatase activity